MTTPSTARKAGPLLGTGSQTAWPFTFKVFAAGDVQVTIANSAGTETLLVLGTDYTVTLNSNQDTSPGGTVNYPISGAALPVGSVLAIIGDLDYDQPLDLPSGGNFSPTALENQLDRSTMQIQQLREEMNRTAKLPPTSSESVEALVDDLQRIADSADNLDTVAGNIADVNTVANDLNEPVSEINTVATSIANVNTVGNNISNVNTVAGISANVTTVAGIQANVTTVAGIAANVTTVAGISGNVTAVAAIDDDVSTVAGISPAVSAVATIDDDVSTVAAIDNDVSTVAGISPAVSTVAANIVDIQNAEENAAAVVSATAQAVDGEKDSFSAGVDYTKNVTTQLTLTYTPAKAGTVKVFFDGVFQHLTEWSLVGQVITFSAAITADKVEALYNIPSQFVGLNNADLEVLGSAQAAAQASAEAAAEAEVAAESARDAALIQAGVYATEAAGIAATSVGDYFKVIGSGDVAAREYLHALSPNLFDAATVRSGFYINSTTGNIQAAAGWGCSAFIPVTAGQQYTLSGTRSRVGIAFYSAASDSAAIAGSYTAGSLTAPTTVTAPAGATHAVFNLYTSTTGPVYSNNQLEQGATATTYIPKGSYSALAAEYASINALETVQDQIVDFQEEIATLLTDYLRNYLANGNIANTSPDWTVEDSASLTLTNVTGIAELAALGLQHGYNVPTAGGVNARIRLIEPEVDALGIASGEHILVGLFVYASNGVSFLTSTASFAIRVDGVTQGFDSYGFIQVSTNVRFLWGKKVATAGDIDQLVIGFNSAGVPASAATRYISGFYVHRSAADFTVPAASEVARLTGWNGEGSRSEFFATVETRLDALEAAIPSRVVLAGDGDAQSYIEVVREGVTIRRSMRVWPTPAINTSGVLNPTQDSVNSIVIRSMGDDPAPYRALGTTIGANHGYAMYSVAMTAHGKTSADIGSVYASGGAQYVIVGINGANAIWMTRRADNSAVPVATFTHVSGGTNTANIVAASSTYNQMYPPFSNRTMQVFADGVEVTSHVADLRYFESVQFVETYDVFEKNDIVEWFVSTGGPGPVPSPSATPGFSVSISYVFDTEGQCTIYTDFLARKTIALTDIMFVMGVRMASGVDGTIQYYIPKTLPVVHQGVTYDYANIDSTDTSAWTTRLNFTPARCEPTGILADRVIQLSDNYGFALGYLPVQSTSLANRRANATVKALQISNSSAKVYMSAIDKGSITLNAGDYFSTIAYRNIVLRNSARTSHYAVRTNGADYLYVDWHAATTDRVPVPPDFVGREFEVVEKSGNVTVMSQALTSNLIVQVSNAASYGYLILKVL